MFGSGGQVERPERTLHRGQVAELPLMPGPGSELCPAGSSAVTMAGGPSECQREMT